MKTQDFKQELLNALHAELMANLELLMKSAMEAKEEAISDEAKPENEYDTRGLEASYLAGAQSQRVEELTAQIQKLQMIRLREFSENSRPEITALVKVSLNGEEEKSFFLLPFAGGTRLQVRNREVTVITPQSPVGKHLLRSEVGDAFEIQTEKNTLEYEVLEIS